MIQQAQLPTTSPKQPMQPHPVPEPPCHHPIPHDARRKFPGRQPLPQPFDSAHASRPRVCLGRVHLNRTTLHKPTFDSIIHRRRTIAGINAKPVAGEHTSLPSEGISAVQSWFATDSFTTYWITTEMCTTEIESAGSEVGNTADPVTGPRLFWTVKSPLMDSA